MTLVEYVTGMVLHVQGVTVCQTQVWSMMHAEFVTETVPLVQVVTEYQTLD
jgi:hypothetical protein